MLAHKKIKILVVDDELSIRESLSGWLQQDGFEVENAADGIVALAMIQETHYDIMLIDVKMPEMDGLTLLKQLKEIEPETRRSDDDGPWRHPRRRRCHAPGRL